MNFSKYILAMLSIALVLPNTVIAMEQNEPERKSDFAQQMPEQPAQPDALEQAIARCDNTINNIEQTMTFSKRRAQEEEQQANTKRATNKKAGNKIPWKKIAAESASMAFGAFCGFLIAKIGKECGPGSKNNSDLVAIPCYAALLLPFAFAKKVNATYWLAGFSTFSSCFLTSSAYNK